MLLFRLILLDSSTYDRFDSESVSTVIQLKSSVQKAIRNKLLEQFPHLEEYIEQIIPKKEPLKLVRCADHIEILANGSGDYLFFRRYEEPYVPTLKLLHKCMYLQILTNLLWIEI